MKKLAIFAATLALSPIASAQAVNDPAVGGQLNRCWGEIASQIAQLDTSGVDANGGGMGVHVRAAAGQGSTFGENIPFGTPFNELNPDGNHGRVGVGNVSAGEPHNTAPGDGGNGQHAINNGGFVAILDPLTGFFGSTFAALICSIAP